MRARLVILLSACILLLGFVVWKASSKRLSSPPATPRPSASTSPPAIRIPATPESAPTAVYAHNLLLRKGPDFRIYVRWLRGEMVRTRRDVNPTFDDPESFFLDIKTGVIRANIGDIGNFLNVGLVANSPLKNITLLADGDNIKLRGTLHKLISLPIELLGSVLRGTLHKLISLPIELLGSVAATPDHRIQVHVTKLSVLKLPLKGLLGGLDINVSDLFHPQGIPGIEVSGNDIYFDTLQLLPPPHIHGQLSKVHVVSPDIEEVYGDAEQAVTQVEQWRNFLRLSDGTIDFGKLTMRHVDLTMVDLSNDAWFDLDLNNYQNQLVNGYTHMTPEAGLVIFMPDLDELPKTKANQHIGLEWMKHRNIPPPSDIISK